MTIKEMSDSLDSMLNSYASQAQFGEEAAKQDIVLDEYEKSLYLTQAQDIVLKSYFQRNTNGEGSGFDDSEKRQIDFSSLITVKTLTEPETAEDAPMPFDERGILFSMPKRQAKKKVNGVETLVDVDGTTDVLFILNEQLITKVGDKPTTGEDKRQKKVYVVVPINYKEYDREMSKPYAQPLKKQAWRLFQNAGTGFDYLTELIPIWDLKDKEEIFGYKMRYVRRPNPIVLTDMPDGLSIEGFDKENPCELNPILHPEIVQRAVEIIIMSRGGVVNNRRENNG